MSPDCLLTGAGRLASVLVIAVAVTGCGGSAATSPTAPTAPTAPAVGAVLQAGVYALAVSSSFPETDAPCSPRQGDPYGRSVNARITLAAETGGWVGRSTSSADGTLELHLRDAGAGQAGGVFLPGGAPVAGTLSGVGVDNGRFSLFPHDARVLASGVASTVDAQLAGDVTTNGFGGVGSLDGVFTYTDGAGVSTTCRGGVWLLSLAFPGS